MPIRPIVRMTNEADLRPYACRLRTATGEWYEPTGGRLLDGTLSRLGTSRNPSRHEWPHSQVLTRDKVS